MRKFFIICAALLLASCQDAPAGYKPAPLNFANAQPIRLNVSEVRIIENYKSPMTVPNVEQDFPVPPTQAIKQWVQQRVQTTGSQGVFEITIDDASVKEVKLPKTKGVKGLFTDDQDSRYDASIKVTMRMYNGTDVMSVASGDVFIKRSKSINEKATVNDRTRMFDTMTKDMMSAFDAEAQARLRQYFAAYMR